ncbi:MAG: hypothetical protein PUG04_05090 [Lachnospiraceae bacterium]|nr:hypothetical protein [Lachnospiraceae bacterium]
MLNLKKGLALVLAAATAFTFAPVANLGAPVQAEAADPTDAEILQAAENATFQNVDANVYLRDVANTSNTINPSYVVTSDGKTSYDGKQLYYAVTAPDKPQETTLTSAQYDQRATGIYQKADKSITSNATETDSTANTKILSVDSQKGSVKLTRASSLPATADFYLAAYKLENNNNIYTLVGFKKITVVKQANATFKLKLASDSYTLALGVDTQTGDITDGIRVSDVQGNYLTSTEIDAFKDKTKWSVSGANVVQDDTLVANPTDAQVDALLAKYKNRNDIYAIYATNTGKFYANAAGKTTVTVSATDNTQRVAQTEITLEVIGTSKYALKATVDGTATTGEIGENKDNPIVLNVKNLNTYDLSKHMYKNNDSIVLSYDSNNAKNTVNATTGVVTATTAVDSFVVTVTGKLNGATVAKKLVYFKVNALPFDTLSVVGEDKDAATVLSKLDYDAVIRNTNNLPTEKKLAGSQIQYVQIEVTGNESSNVTEALSIASTGGAIVTASLQNQWGTAVKDVTNNGVITLNEKATTGVAAIKLISSATANNELTESYVFVVIDKKDNDAKLAPAAFKIGTKADGTNAKYQSTIDFGSEYKVNSVTFLDQDDDLLATKTLYPDAKNINTNFKESETAKSVYIATAEGKTEHVLLEYGEETKGAKYQIVTITSVPGVTDSVTKIEDATTNKVIYTSDMGTIIPQIVINGVTTLKVTISYPIDKNQTTANISSTNLYSGHAEDSLNQSIMTATKETVKTGDTYNTFYLYPTANGTQVVKFTPSGNISETDRSIVANAVQQLAVTYRSSAALSKVTGLKVANKKGAKVSVTWASQGGRVNYRVYKKVGNGKWIAKNVTSNKATLSVKKGAKVQVKVKAFIKNSAGTTTWGPKAAKKTLKTDKK